MKKVLFSITCIAFISLHLNGQVLHFQDFEGHTSGSPLALSLGDPWTTWSGSPGGMDDAEISNEQAFAGENSALFTGPAAGGPADVILKLGDRTAGLYKISWMMYIPSGFGGYFNIQHSETPGVEWGLEVAFRADNTIEFTTDSATATTATYPSDEWFLLSMIINFALDQGTLTINEGTPLAWNYSTLASGGQSTLNQLGAINFFSYAGGDPVRYYIDDLLYEDLSITAIEEHDNAGSSIFPNPTTDLITISIADRVGPTRYSIFDLTGREAVPLGSLIGSDLTVVDLKDLPAGLYFVRIQDGPNEMVHQLVKHH